MVDSLSRFFGDAEVTDNRVMSMFEIRGSEVYATSANDRYDDTSTPMFEIQGTDIYPTIHNDHYEYTYSAAFEIRDRYAYPTYMNDDDEGFDVIEAAANGAGMSFGETMVALGMALFVRARVNAKERRQEAAEQEQAAATSVPPAPPGWYTTDYGRRYWNGAMWTGQTQPVRSPTHRPMTQEKGRGPIVTAWVLAILTAGYMLPWAIAVTRRTSNSRKVGWLCFLLGWTIVGWIATFVMACAGPTAASQQ